jgi:hypothetical protein
MVSRYHPVDSGHIVDLGAVFGIPIGRAHHYSHFKWPRSLGAGMRSVTSTRRATAAKRWHCGCVSRQLPVAGYAGALVGPWMNSCLGWMDAIIKIPLELKPSVWRSRGTFAPWLFNWTDSLRCGRWRSLNCHRQRLRQDSFWAHTAKQLFHKVGGSPACRCSIDNEHVCLKARCYATTKIYDILGGLGRGFTLCSGRCKRTRKPLIFVADIRTA